MEGFLYFLARRDDMIKTSGYRVSPTEVEEAIYGSGYAAECAAFGVAHDVLGQAIVAVVVPRADRLPDTTDLQRHCREKLPAYMVPARIEWRSQALPRNPNGKIDRKTLAIEFSGVLDEQQS